jgi:Flp pilus assembly protein TadG
MCLPLFALIVGAIEMGRAMMVYEFMANAARAGCRRGCTLAAVGTPATNQATITTVVNDTLRTALVGTSTTDIYYYRPTSGTNYAPPNLQSTWSNYGSTAATQPIQGDYIRVRVRVNVRDVTWLPGGWFLKNGTFEINEDMLVE